MAVIVAEIDELRQILEWLGFTQDTNRIAVTDDAFVAYDDVLNLKSNHITNLSESFTRKSVTNSQIIFGNCKIKKATCFTELVKYFYRISSTPALD